MAVLLALTLVPWRVVSPCRTASNPLNHSLIEQADKAEAIIRMSEIESQRRSREQSMSLSSVRQHVKTATFGQGNVDVEVRALRDQRRLIEAEERRLRAMLAVETDKVKHSQKGDYGAARNALKERRDVKVRTRRDEFMTLQRRRREQEAHILKMSPQIGLADPPQEIIAGLRRMYAPQQSQAQASEMQSQSRAQIHGSVSGAARVNGDIGAAHDHLEAEEEAAYADADSAPLTAADLIDTPAGGKDHGAVGHDSNGGHDGGSSGAGSNVRQDGYASAALSGQGILGLSQAFRSSITSQTVHEADADDEQDDTGEGSRERDEFLDELGSGRPSEVDSEIYGSGRSGRLAVPVQGTGLGR